MSDIQNAIRQFGDAVKAAEELQANQLNEIKDGIRSTNHDFDRRIRTQLQKIEGARQVIALATNEINVILEEAATAFTHVMAEIESHRLVALAPPQQKEETNG